MFYIFLLFITMFGGLLALVFGGCYLLKKMFEAVKEPAEPEKVLYSVAFDSVKEKYYIKEGKKRICNWFGRTVYYESKAKALYYVRKLNDEE